ncbi:MAG: hypothetical protein HQM04_09360 [Magnetococcales bacterium]|nr:hypothetical protein [Magnetococcales bacterium]MBF0115240.1 hypothetical protein [Magnetococcales bacterium]
MSCTPQASSRQPFLLRASALSLLLAGLVLAGSAQAENIGEGCAPGRVGCRGSAEPGKAAPESPKPPAVQPHSPAPAAAQPAVIPERARPVQTPEPRRPPRSDANPEQERPNQERPNLERERVRDLPQSQRAPLQTEHNRPFAAEPAQRPHRPDRVRDDEKTAQEQERERAREQWREREQERAKERLRARGQEEEREQEREQERERVKERERERARVREWPQTPRTTLPENPRPALAEPSQRLHRPDPLPEGVTGRAEHDRERETPVRDAIPRHPLLPETNHPQQMPAYAEPTRTRPALLPNREEPRSRQSTGERRDLPERAVPARQAIPVNPSTTLLMQAGKEAMTVQHKAPDGSEWFMHARQSGKGRPNVEVYRYKRDAENGAQSRDYADGRRVVVARDSVTHVEPQRMTLTTYNNGLRSAYLPAERIGRGASEHKQRYFQEEFATKVYHGHAQRMIRRTLYAFLEGARVVVLPQPQVLWYAPVVVRRVEVYSYYPVLWQPTIYDLLLQPLATPLVVTRECPWCPPPVVVYSNPVSTYRQPVDLLSDWQLSGAMYDGMVWSNAAAMPEQTATEQALSDSVRQLQQQLAEALQENDTLRSELASQQQQWDAIVHWGQSASLSPGEADNGPELPQVTVPERVRQQVRRQVQEEIVRHQEQKPNSLAELLASDRAQQTLFQVADRLDVTDAESGMPCLLSTGDLLQLQHLPGAEESIAAMKVVTGKATSCPVGSVVHVGMADLQEMLNAFTQRLEKNVQKLSEQVAPTLRR